MDTMPNGRVCHHDGGNGDAYVKVLGGLRPSTSLLPKARNVQDVRGAVRVSPTYRGCECRRRRYYRRSQLVPGPGSRVHRRRDRPTSRDSSGQGGARRVLRVFLYPIDTKRKGLEGRNGYRLGVVPWEFR